jgi:hypothetical protein
MKIYLLFFIVILAQNFNLMINENIILEDENLLMNKINSGIIWPFNEGPNVPY